MIYMTSKRLFAVVVVLIAWLNPGCKPIRTMFSISSFSSSGTSCLLDQSFRFLEIQVHTIDSPYSYGQQIYDFELSDNFFIPYFDKGVSSQPGSTNFDGISTIGNYISGGLSAKIRDKIKYVSGSFSSVCMPGDYWQTKSSAVSGWPGTPTVKIQINHRDLFEGQFSPTVTDISSELGCPSGQIAKKVVLPKAQMSSNPIYQARQSEC